MATYEILSIGELRADGVRPIRLRVLFGEQVFDQDLISAKEGNELFDQLQDYADLYEADWKALNLPVEPLP